MLSSVLISLLLVIMASAEDIEPIRTHSDSYPYVKMPYFSPREIENAFAIAEQRAQERQNLEDSLVKKGRTISKSSFSAEARHQRFTAIKPRSIEIDINQKIFEEASNILAEQKKLTSDQVKYGLSRVSLPNGSQRAQRALQTCQKLFGVDTCDRKTQFRTADGSCNNLDNPLWGKSFTCFERLVAPAYADDLDAPRVALSGRPLPNPRAVSRAIHNDIDIPAREYTLMTMQWGQFMDHDMTLTPMTRAGRSMEMIECCPFDDGQPKHPACFPIEIPPGDNFYAPRRQTCLNFVRSAACDAGCTLGPRQQTNQLTAFIDASNVYGSEDNETQSLRTFSDGLLKFQTSNVAGELLPRSIDPVNDQCSRQEGLQDCFHAGDERVNEQPGLTCMHTIWLRQHNRIARRFKQIYPKATDEQLFQNARKIVGAQLQAITYGEFLPVVLGPQYMSFYDLGLRSDRQYDPKTQPTILHEFATAAYRFGHTLIQNIFLQYDSSNRNSGPSLNLSENFFFPQSVFQGRLPNIVRGLYFSPAQQYDRHIVEAVTNNLYKEKGTPFGMDLPALNMQRSRDHGISGYTTYIKYFFGIDINRFSDLGTFMIRDNWKRLSELYEVPGDIDLFVGGVCETPLQGGVVGPTFGAIIGTQFFHLKYGDRFWFENEGLPNSFSSDQIEQIRNVKLSRVLCWNGGLSTVRENVFLPRSSLRSCDDLDELNLDYF